MLLRSVSIFYLKEILDFLVDTGDPLLDLLCRRQLMLSDNTLLVNYSVKSDNTRIPNVAVSYFSLLSLKKKNKTKVVKIRH